MGLGDKFKSLVLTEYKADTKQMRRELNKMSAEQQKQAKVSIESAEAQNAAIDKQIAMLGKAVIAIGAVTAAYKVAQVGIEAYAERSRLNAATVGVDLDGLKKATNGLVSETKLLEFASKSMNGTFKLSQSEMETALKGVIGLRNEGNELSKALENVGKALQEGTSEPLKELGHNFKTVNDTATGVRDVLADLAKTAREKGGDLSIPGDAMAESSVEMADAVNDLTTSLGELAVKLAPVISALAKMVALMAKLGAVSDAIAGVNYEDKISSEKLAIVQQLSKGEDPVLRARLNTILRAEIAANRAKTLDESLRRNRANGDAIRNRVEVPPPGSGRSGKRKGADAGPSGLGLDIYGSAVSSVTGLGAGIGGYFGGVKDKAAADEEQYQGIKEEDRLAYNEMIERSSELVAMQREQEQSVMASIFGTPSEIDAQTTSIMMLSSAFDSVAGAFGAGVDALITGSGSFADAFKNAIGESLRAMSVEMSISALKHTAYGLASVAFMDGRGATAHFAAAGQFGAGAIAAGVGARLMGAGQPSNPSAGGSRPNTAGSAGVGSAAPSSGNEGSTRIVILGDDYGSMSARERESRIRETMRGAGVSITGDFAVNG